MKQPQSHIQEHLDATAGGIILTGTWRDKVKGWKRFPNSTEDLAMFDDDSPRNPPTGIEAPIDLWDDESTFFWRNLRNPNFIINTEETTKGLKILAEMEIRDTDISSSLVDRALVISSLDWGVNPGDPAEQASRDHAKMFESDLDDIDLPAFMRSLTYDPFYGFGMREIPWLWKQDHWGFEDPLPIPQWAWTFTKDGRPQIIPAGHDPTQEGINVTPGRFLYTLSRDPVNGRNPYGKSDGCDVYYPARWRNWTIRALLKAAAKIGGVIAFGKYVAGAAPEQKAELLGAVKAVMNNQAVIMPDSQSIEIPDYGRISVKDFFTAVDDLFARMIRKRLTGAEGRGASQTGTFAEKKVDKEVSDSWKEGAAKFNMAGVNRLARWWTDFNFGHDVPSPQFWLDFEGREDQKVLVENIDTITTIVPLKEEEVYEKTGWTKPGPEDITTGVRTKASPFSDLGSMQIPEEPQRKAIPAEASPEKPADEKDASEEDQEFHDCGHGQWTPIGEMDAATFAENAKLVKQWEREQDILTGKILADAQVNEDSYPVFMREIRSDLAGDDVDSYNAARKAVGISSESRADFRDYMKGAMASVFTLHTVQQLDKIVEDVTANFAEDDVHILFANDKISGGDKSIFQDAEAIEFLEFEEAMEILRRRAPNLSPLYYEKVEQNLHGWATTVSNLESQKTVQAVMDSLAKAEEAGQTFTQWRKDIDDILSTEDIEKLKPGQLETVFITNLQSAYNAAGERLVNEVDPSGELYPAFEFFNGDPVSAICIARNGKIFPRSSTENIPPLHFRCKSTIIWLSKFETFKTVAESTRESLPPPDKGFDTSPAKLLNAGIA